MTSCLVMRVESLPAGLSLVAGSVSRRVPYIDFIAYSGLALGLAFDGVLVLKIITSVCLESGFCGPHNGPLYLRIIPRFR
jgi:hypothetical protein